MSSQRYEMLTVNLPYRWELAYTMMEAFWKKFYMRVMEANYPCDRAIWLAVRYPAFVGVKPGSPNDDPHEEPLFVISVGVPGLDETVAAAEAACPQKKDLESVAAPIYRQFEKWISAEILKAWKEKDVQKLHKRAIPKGGKFGIYLTAVEDAQTDEFEFMQWLAGDRLHVTRSRAKPKPANRRAVRKASKTSRNSPNKS